MNYQSATGAAPFTYSTVENPRQQIPLSIYPDCAAVVQERRQIKQHHSAQSLNKLPADEVIACIEEHGWYFNNPNPIGYLDVPSPENFIDILARMYLTTTKMKDKFMPTQERLNEYINQLENPDPARGDAGWRYYTKRTFEYFPEPVLHPVSHREVHGLYKKLSAKDAKICNKVHSWAFYGVELDKKEKYKVLQAYEKATTSQVRVSPFEESYNIILSAHVERSQNGGPDIHYGRDMTYQRVTHLSSSITKEIAFRFLQNCPGCAKRTGICSRARDKAIKKCKSIAQEEANPAIATAEKNKVKGQATELGDNVKDMRTQSCGSNFESNHLRHTVESGGLNLDLCNMADNSDMSLVTSDDSRLLKQNAVPVKSRDNGVLGRSPYTIGHSANRFDEHSQHQHFDPKYTQDPGELELREPQSYRDPTAAPVNDKISQNRSDSHTDPSSLDPIIIRAFSEVTRELEWEDISFWASKIVVPVLQGTEARIHQLPNPFSPSKIDQPVFRNPEAHIYQLHYPFGGPQIDEPFFQNPETLIHQPPSDEQSANLSVQPRYFEDLRKVNFGQYLEDLDWSDLDMAEF